MKQIFCNASEAMPKCLLYRSKVMFKTRNSFSLCFFHIGKRILAYMTAIRKEMTCKLPTELLKDDTFYKSFG